MVGATDQKTEWNLGEALMWIRTRDHDRVAGMWELSEFEAISLALFDRRQLPSRTVRGLVDQAAPRVPSAGAHANTAAAGYQLPGTPAGAESVLESESGPGLDRVLQDLMRRVQTRKVGMTIVKTGEAGIKRLPVSAAGANGLELRVTEDAAAPVIAWSRTEQAIVGTSPWFSRKDVVRVWPELSKKTAAVAVAILKHLTAISTPEDPLIKPEALDRCLAEVPKAYPEAFKRAWALLDPSRKRGRGKHGRRAL